LGCTGWALPEWTGKFFSDDAKPEQYLNQYASVFNSVEGNTTFYQVPEKTQLQKWAGQTPKGFKFCFKFPRHITHEQLLSDVEDDVLSFVELFEVIRDKTGPFMIQLPAEFSPAHLSRLEDVLSVLPGVFNYAVEVRHPDFFDKGKNEHNLEMLLKSFGGDRIMFDTRKLHSVKKTSDKTIRAAQKKKPKTPVRFGTTGSRPVVRYVGTNDILNNEAHLKEWAIIVGEWIREGLHPYVFIHSPDRVSQPKLCRHFHQLLSGLIELPVLPSWPCEKQDKQLGLF